MKKELVAVILFTSLVFVLSIYFGIFSKHKYTNLVIDNASWNKIISSKEATTEEIIKDIKFNDSPLFYDSISDTYLYSLNNSEDAYTPYIKYKNVSKVANLAFKEYIDDEKISEDNIFEMLIYTNKTYKIIKIKCTKLPILSINYDGEIAEEYIPSSLVLYDNIYDIVTESESKIKLRGASSKTFPKKGFRISLSDGLFKKNKSLLGMRKDDDWVLYAAYNDQEKIRNVFASKLWYECCSKNNSFDLTNGMEYKYVELFINGEYEGLYALGYPIDEKTLNANDDYIFKKVSWSDNVETNILKYKNSAVPGYELKSSLDEDTGYKYLVDYYDKLLHSSNKDDIYNYVDISNSIDIFLFYNLIQGSDNINDYELKNTYVTLKNGNGIKVIYTPWDMDYSFGNTYSNIVSDNLTNMYSISPNKNYVMKLNAAYKLRKLDSSIYDLIYNRYTYLRTHAWSDENIIKLLESYEKDIYSSGAFIRDEARWPEGNYINVNIKLSKFKTYVIERLNYLDEYVSSYTGH